MRPLVSFVYYAAWSAYARRFFPWNIPTAGVTHVNYAFARIDAGSGKAVLGDAYADAQAVYTQRGASWSDPEVGKKLHGNLGALFDLKRASPWLKVGISIGGWTWSGPFSRAVATARGRTILARSAIDLALAYGFDYVDLDWEYPGGGGLPSNGSSPLDGQNLVAFAREFRAQAAKVAPFLFLTAAVSGGPPTLSHYDFAGMAAHFRYVLVMAYDYAGPWSDAVEHQANVLRRSADVKCAAKDAVEYMVAHGLPAEQIVLGVPLYGRSFAGATGLGRPFAGPGPGTWEPGILDYKALPLPGSRTLWEAAAQASFAYDRRSRVLVSYDAPSALALKMRLVEDLGLAGTMAWEVSGDAEFSSPRSFLGMVARHWGPRLDRSPARLCFPESPFPNLRCQAGSADLVCLEWEDGPVGGASGDGSGASPAPASPIVSGPVDGSSGGSGPADAVAGGNSPADAVAGGSGPVDAVAGGSGPVDGVAGGSGPVDSSTGGSGSTDSAQINAPADDAQSGGSADSNASGDQSSGTPEQEPAAGSDAAGDGSVQAESAAASIWTGNAALISNAHGSANAAGQSTESDWNKGSAAASQQQQRAAKFNERLAQKKQAAHPKHMRAPLSHVDHVPSGFSTQSASDQAPRHCKRYAQPPERAVAALAAPAALLDAPITAEYLAALVDEHIQYVYRASPMRPGAPQKNAQKTAHMGRGAPPATADTPLIGVPVFAVGADAAAAQDAAVLHDPENLKALRYPRAHYNWALAEPYVRAMLRDTGIPMPDQHAPNLSPPRASTDSDPSVDLAHLNAQY